MILNPSYLPQQPLYGPPGLPETEATSNDQNILPGVGWQLAAQPLPLNRQQLEDLQRLGPLLLRFMQGLDTLYRESLKALESPEKASQKSWIASVLNQGKPEDLLRFAQMKRFKNRRPWVIRPDLLITETGWALCELDSVPGGIGFTAALQHAYKHSGFTVIEGQQPIELAFEARLIAEILGNNTPPAEANDYDAIAILISDEAQDYRREMNDLVGRIQSHHPQTPLVVIHPKEVDWVKDRLVLTDPATGAERTIRGIYRFFELFDLPNIPKMELIQYAIKKGAVQCTPPFKPWLEEKLALALFHHPTLQAYWEKTLGKSDFEWLQQWIPPSWILDPTPLPPHAIIPNLSDTQGPLQDYRAMAQWSQKERQMVIKPSGFSPLAWGSRGVTIGHDVSSEQWQQAIEDALNQFGSSPHILQRFIKPAQQPWLGLHPESGEPIETSARIRLCPYYFVSPDETSVELVGILATACPADKKIIHGMQDAWMAPCMTL